MLYTVMPIEDVLDGLSETPPITAEVTMNGITLEIEPLGSFQAKVVRVLSTDPRHYLESHCQPGAIIRGEIV